MINGRICYMFKIGIKKLNKNNKIKNRRRLLFINLFIRRENMVDSEYVVRYYFDKSLMRY